MVSVRGQVPELSSLALQYTLAPEGRKAIFGLRLLWTYPLLSFVWLAWPPLSLQFKGRHCPSSLLAILLLSSALFDRVPLSPSTFSCITGLLLNRRLVSLASFGLPLWLLMRKRDFLDLHVWNISPCGLAFPLDCYAQTTMALVFP